VKKWQFERASKSLDDRRTQKTLKWTDPKSGLEIRCVDIVYQDFPTVEWTVYFKNIGTADTSILSNIQALDARFERGDTVNRWRENGAWKMIEGYGKANHFDTGEFVLHHAIGSYAGFGEYQPLKTILDDGVTKRLSAFIGRPTEGDMPYFNLEWTDRGVIVAVGWPGQWASELSRDDDRGIQLRAGQEHTHFRLHPGEEVRPPLIVLQFWSGDRIRSQNVWRRWMIAHNLPRPGGKPVRPQWAGQSGPVYHEMSRATEENQKMFIDRYLEEKLGIDTWWMDAYWFDARKTDGGLDAPLTPHPERFPNGLRPVTDYAHSKGLRTILWVEPENYIGGSYLKKEHPEWMVGVNAWAAHDLLNWGHPEALEYIIDNQARIIREQGVDTYRLDFNFNPLRWWFENDRDDRQGITENGYVTGFLAFYDALLARKPELLIDNCASGGRRNNLETMRRSVPLWHSDFAHGPTQNQSQTYGLAFWLPYFGTANDHPQTYVFRSAMTPALNTGYDLRNRELDYDLIRRLTKEWREVADYYLGDYYPLTSYSLEIDVWMAWQFDRPQRGEGMVQAFRRQACPTETIRFRLRQLDVDATCLLKDMDGGPTRQISGRDLMERGLRVELAETRSAALVTYRKAGD
jgi:alpha-galactosidase